MNRSVDLEMTDNGKKLTGYSINLKDLIFSVLDTESHSTLSNKEANFEPMSIIRSIEFSNLALLILKDGFASLSSVTMSYQTLSHNRIHIDATELHVVIDD